MSEDEQAPSKLGKNVIRSYFYLCTTCGSRWVKKIPIIKETPEQVSVDIGSALIPIDTTCKGKCGSNWKPVQKPKF